MEKIGVVCVDGRVGRAAESLAAVCHSAERIGASEVILFGCEEPAERPAFVKFLRIASLGYCDYSAFMLYALGQLIRSEYILVVQADGWVMDETRWSDRFLEYDYIGAPTHRARVLGEQGPEWSSRFGWVGFEGPADVVLNGGFSLRSKRLLKAPAELRLPLHLPPFTVDGWPLRISSPDDEVNEDVQLCVSMRNALEGAGLKFAPLDAAGEFAFEQLIPGAQDGLLPAQVFGQHNRLRKLVKASPPTVRYAISEQEVDGIFREREVVEHLARLGYHIEFVSAAA